MWLNFGGVTQEATSSEEKVTQWGLRYSVSLCWLGMQLFFDLEACHMLLDYFIHPLCVLAYPAFTSLIPCALSQRCEGEGRATPLKIVWPGSPRRQLPFYWGGDHSWFSMYADAECFDIKPLLLSPFSKCSVLPMASVDRLLRQPLATCSKWSGVPRSYQQMGQTALLGWTWANGTVQKNNIHSP